MDYRRRYLRRLANQSQENQNEENATTNKNEAKNIPEKVEDKSNTKNIYLQKLLVKNNNSPSTSSINISSRVNDNLPSYSNNIKDAYSTEENKQKGVKYVFHKRNDEKYGTENIKEENNPPSNKYYNYSKNTSSYSKVESSLPDSNNNKTTIESKNIYQNYVRKNRNFNNNFQEQNNNQENDIYKKEQSNIVSKKRFQVSASATNIIFNNKTGKEETTLTYNSNGKITRVYSVSNLTIIYSYLSSGKDRLDAKVESKVIVNFYYFYKTEHKE